jgi:hypothetical protein
LKTPAEKLAELAVALAASAGESRASKYFPIGINNFPIANLTRNQVEE